MRVTRQNTALHMPLHTYTTPPWCGTKFEQVCLKRHPYGLRMNAGEAFPSHRIGLFFAIDAPYKRLSFNNKCTKLFYFEQVLRDLARILIMVRHQLFFGVCD